MAKKAKEIRKQIEYRLVLEDSGQCYFNCTTIDDTCDAYVTNKVPIDPDTAKALGDMFAAMSRQYVRVKYKGEHPYPERK